MDDAVVVSGSRIVLDHPGELEVASVAVSEGGILEMQGSARLTVLNDFVNSGEVRSRNLSLSAISVHGAFTSTGAMGIANGPNGGPPLFDLHGDATASANTYAYLTFVGNGTRTIWTERADSLSLCQFGESFSLRGDNKLPNVTSFANAGVTVTVLPAATVDFGQTNINGFSVVTAETQAAGFQFINRGVAYSTIAEYTQVYDVGASFEGQTPADTLRVTSHPGVTHPQFAASLRRWWRFETESQKMLNYVQFFVLAQDFNAAGVPDVESLHIYHSADEGASWARVSDEINTSRVDPNGPFGNTPGLGWIQHSGPVPATGIYALSATDPLESTAAGPGITLNIVGPPEIRVGGPPTDYSIIYQNTGQTALGRGLLAIRAEGGVQFVHADQSGRPYHRFLSDSDVFVVRDDGTELAMLVTPDLAPGEARVVRLRVTAVPAARTQKTGQVEPVQLNAQAGPAIAFGMTVAAGLGIGYLVDLLANFLEEGLSDPCLPATFDNFKNAANNAFDETDAEYNPFGDSETPFMTVATEGGLELIGEGFVKEAFGILGVVENTVTLGGAVVDGLVKTATAEKCNAAGPAVDFARLMSLLPITSWDPNAKFGPVGTGTGGFLQSADRMVYRISFENKAEATAAAYRIAIKDTLSSVYDWASVERIGESHDGFTFSVIDSVLSWEVEGIELPPNVSPPEGEGFVEFAVNVHPGLPTGTVIANRATIVFDLNEPIETNVHVNTLDQDPPAGIIDALPASTTGGVASLSWTATDQEGGSGYESANIFASANGGPFAFVASTGGSSFEYPVVPGTDYEFYILARDSVGNVQSRVSGTTSTTVVGIDETRARPDLVIESNYPNPFARQTALSFAVGHNARTSIAVYDVLGRRIANLLDERLTPGEHRLVWDAESVANGVYFIELKQGEARTVRAVTKAR